MASVSSSEARLFTWSLDGALATARPTLPRLFERAAECHTAIRQVAKLRYGGFGAAKA